MRVLSRFLMSAFDSSHFPAPSLPEVAFLGRSNVGKSSVINSLLGSKIARTVPRLGAPGPLISLKSDGPESLAQKSFSLIYLVTATRVFLNKCRSNGRVSLNRIFVSGHRSYFLLR